MAKTLWREEYYVRAYSLARGGYSDKRIAQTLGVSYMTLDGWKRKYPALVNALDEGRRTTAACGKTDFSFRDYVYKQLPTNLQVVWDAINACDEEPNGRNRVDALLEDQGVNARKHLFLYAIVDSNFSLSQACRKLGMSAKTYWSWIENDPDFVELMDEIHWHKKNFFEEALVGLVASGDSPATIFTNKTFNKDRGYNEKVDVNLTGSLGINTVPIPLADLGLPLELQKEILAALRAKTHPPALTLEHDASKTTPG